MKNRKLFIELSEPEWERELLLHEKEFDVIETRPLGEDRPVVYKIVPSKPSQLGVTTR